MATLSLNPRLFRFLLPAVAVLLLSSLALVAFTAYSRDAIIPSLDDLKGFVSHAGSKPDRRPPNDRPPPRYKPVPEWLPPPIKDPFPLLANTFDAKPPPIPSYNIPRPDLHKEYNLTQAPPLFIGFTRQWPMLLQCVVSYITAGWPADQIYVVENTGVHGYNKAGKLSLQNPFYLNHTTLNRLGVQVIQTPVLLTFAQLQNFFLDIAYERGYEYYMYSHQDIVVFSFEDGRDDYERGGDRPPELDDDEDQDAILNPKGAHEPGYRTIYENCLRELRYVLDKGERWAFRWFQYDYLTLVNREAVDAVGGWDVMIPYYSSDCDMNSKLLMDGWTVKHRRAGHINDVSSVITDLAVFYRDPRAGKPEFSDPNPLPPDEEERISKAKEEEELKAKEEAVAKAEEEEAARIAEGGEAEKKDGEQEPTSKLKREGEMPSDPLEYFRILNKVGVDMGQYKYRDKSNLRNTWQLSQRGGQGEPYYYDPMGFVAGFTAQIDVGRRVFTEKWGHRGCDLIGDTSLRLEDQWRVEHDWDEPEE
ncbi:hypothetical protein V8F20_007448 [Naviculisporaceae sp. PSN 640]